MWPTLNQYDEVASAGFLTGEPGMSAPSPTEAGQPLPIPLPPDLRPSVEHLVTEDDTPVERAEREGQRAETAEQRAESAEQRAVTAEKRAEHLAARLRELGIEPNNLTPD
jgi:hypothetical protein